MCRTLPSTWPLLLSGGAQAAVLVVAVLWGSRLPWSWVFDSWFLGFFFKYVIYLLLERREGREKEGSISVWLPLMRPLLGPGPQPRHVP